MSMIFTVAEIGFFLMSASMAAVSKGHSTLLPVEMAPILEKVPSATFAPALETLTFPQGCPADRPEFNSPCGANGEQCEYGKQECCGHVSPQVQMTCQDNSWLGFYVDTRCMFGIPCPGESTTTTESYQDYEERILREENEKILKDLAQ